MSREVHFKRSRLLLANRVKTEGEATKRAMEIARAANCTIPRAASEGDENYDYTHDVFDVSRRLFKWRIVVFKIFVEYIQFMVEIYLSIFKNLLILVVNRLFIIILGIMKKKILVCMTLVFLKCEQVQILFKENNS